MKKILLTLSILAIVIGCNNESIAIKGDKFYFCNEEVGTFMPNTQTGIRVKDAVKKIDDNIFKVTRTFTAKEDIDSARLTFDFCHTHKCQQAIIPSVCYNGNHWGRGKEPKGYQTNGVWHTYSYRRTPIPGVTYSEGEKFAVAVWSEAPTSEADGFSCSIMPDSTCVTHSLIIPEEERPFTYAAKNVYKKEFTKKMSLKKGEKKIIQAYIFVADKSTTCDPLALFLDKAWASVKKDYAKTISTDKVWEYGVKYTKEHLWAEEGTYKGFNIGLLPYGENGWRQRQGGKYEIGWCGQNASFINTLFVDYLKNGSTDSRDKALAALDAWTAPELQRENGFYVSHYDNILSKRQNIVSDACNLGTAAYNFFETAELLEKCNLPERIARVKDIALGICNFVKADQQSSGVYGKCWNEKGECLYRDGTVGAFMIPPMLIAYKQTNDKSYLQSAQQAYNYYYGEFLKNGYTTAGALDTWCIDKESSMPMLRASLNLFDITGDSTYIANAEKISYYLSTWLWHYKAYYENNTEMTRHDYNTFGATSVSVQHHHLDVYAIFWVGDWLKLAEITGKSIWREKAIAIWKYGCQLVSDGTLKVNGRVRPVGGQNEAFFNCRWEFGDDTSKSRINDWLVAWPNAFRLEFLRKLDDWSLLDL